MSRKSREKDPADASSIGKPKKLDIDAAMLLRLLLDSISDCSIIMLDESGAIVTCAAGAKALHGYSEEEIIGKNFSIFYVDEDKQSGFPRTILSSAAENGRWEGDCLHVRKDGSRYWANVVVMPLRSEEGGATGFAKLTRDITDSRRTQEMLRLAQVELEARVADRTRELSDRTRELAEANAELSRLAMTDPLTGLLNRRQLFVTGAAEVDRAHRYRRPLAACVIDVDHFKEINDRHGHAAGDAGLVEIVDRIGGLLRTGDIFARLAGDEFVVLLLETDSDMAGDVAQRLRQAVTDRPLRYSEREIPMSISIGVAALADDEPFNDLLERADRALLSAKSSRNKVQLAP